MLRRLRYLRRIFSAYALPGRSQLSFWHETPEASPRIAAGELGDYFMTFAGKADYAGPFDPAGIPLLDYHGVLGPQYNPIAIAQYGLANYNRHRQGGDASRLQKALLCSDWLVSHLESNPAGVPVWNHHFDWDYRTPLKAPWYSGLAQGQGISLLVRAHRETGKAEYLETARRAFRCFSLPVDQGGVLFHDDRGHDWIEEYIVSPPTHILNGFIWALWGVLDFHAATGDPEPRRLWERGVRTLEENLRTYDSGFWSLYEHSGTRLRMIASRFYHALHIVQLRVMFALTGSPVFRETADRWEVYASSFWKRARAGIHKVVFKLWYY